MDSHGLGMSGRKRLGNRALHIEVRLEGGGPPAGSVWAKVKSCRSRFINLGFGTAGGAPPHRPAQGTDILEVSSPGKQIHSKRRIERK